MICNLEPNLEIDTLILKKIVLNNLQKSFWGHMDFGCYCKIRASKFTNRHKLATFCGTFVKMGQAVDVEQQIIQHTVQWILTRLQNSCDKQNVSIILLSTNRVKLSHILLTASSGFIPLDGSFPLKNSLTNCWTLGIRVLPPTKTISCTSFLFISASSKTFCTGFIVDLNKSWKNTLS